MSPPCTCDFETFSQLQDHCLRNHKYKVLEKHEQMYRKKEIQSRSDTSGSSRLPVAKNETRELISSGNEENKAIGKSRREKECRTRADLSTGVILEENGNPIGAVEVHSTADGTAVLPTLRKDESVLDSSDACSQKLNFSNDVVECVQRSKIPEKY